MRVAVVDGQGGGIGKAIVERLKASQIADIEILALGTNSAATGQMLKAGADLGATGENAIVYNVDRVDVIAGVIAILAANSMMGELTPAMAMSISSSDAKKILLPVNRCGIQIVGVGEASLTFYIDEAVRMIRELSIK